MSVLTRLTPVSLRGYNKSWFAGDIVAGATLAAIAIPEVMGYSTIAQMPVVTGLYTIMLPTLVFALLGASKLLVVGADSATAALMAAGLAGLGIASLTPYSDEWVAYAGLVALVCGGLLVLARLLKLGFLGDFLSASVLIGFLSGVGIQVMFGQVPDMLGIPKGTGTWLQQQWAWISDLSAANTWTVAFAVGTILIIEGFKRFIPRIPGAVVAVILSIILSNALDATSQGVAVIGPVQGGLPPIGLPQGLSWGDIPTVLGISVSCVILIIAQSAATSRSFAMKHEERVDINRDIVGLSGANIAAGLSGTFVVNGSPTKTEILDEQHGRTQLATMTMVAVVTFVLLFLTGYLTNMPKSVLAAVVFLIGVSLVDIVGLKRIWAVRRSESVIAAITAIVVITVGVEQGIILAIILSVLELVRRAYSPKDFLIGVDQDGEATYSAAEPGAESLPGLLFFRFDAQMFYANASHFVDDVQELIAAAPHEVRWLIIDCSALTDVDYSAGRQLAGLIKSVHSRGIVFALAKVDPELRRTLEIYGTLDDFDNEHIYLSVHEAAEAFQADASASPSR